MGEGVLDLSLRERAPSTVWHEVECGGYAADLPLWELLASEANGPVLELGCGIGRVALRLARAGFEVTALDRDRELLAELERRAATRGLPVTAVAGDARELRLPGRFALIAAPMQLAQLLGAAGRAGALASAAEHLTGNGRLAVSLLAGEPETPRRAPPPLPDVLERGGWIYSSLPVQARRSGDRLEVRRLRQVVSPSGELREEVSVTHLDLIAPAQLEAEAARAGLRPAGRRPVPATPEHLGSTVVLLRAA
jgi:SAM-dependent methyltransferase